MTQALNRRLDPGADPHEEVTRGALAQLESGEIPWLVGGPTDGAPVGMPSDPTTGRLYDGLAVVQLWRARSARGYPTHYWSTRQRF